VETVTAVSGRDRGEFVEQSVSSEPRLRIGVSSKFKKVRSRQYELAVRERLPRTASSYARRAARDSTALDAIATALGGVPALGSLRR
jgi:hypothetical protein